MLTESKSYDLFLELQMEALVIQIQTMYPNHPAVQKNSNAFLKGICQFVYKGNHSLNSHPFTVCPWFSDGNESKENGSFSDNAAKQISEGIYDDHSKYW